MSDNSSVAKKDDDVNSLIKIPIRHECYNSLSIKDITVDKFSEYETSLIKQDILRKSLPMLVREMLFRGLIDITRKDDVDYLRDTVHKRRYLTEEIRTYILSLRSNNPPHGGFLFLYYFGERSTTCYLITDSSHPVSSSIVGGGPEM